MKHQNSLTQSSSNPSNSIEQSTVKGPENLLAEYYRSKYFQQNRTMDIATVFIKNPEVRNALIADCFYNAVFEKRKL